MSKSHMKKPSTYVGGFLSRNLKYHEVVACICATAGLFLLTCRRILYPYYTKRRSGSYTTNDAAERYFCVSQQMTRNGLNGCTITKEKRIARSVRSWMGAGLKSIIHLTGRIIHFAIAHLIRLSMRQFVRKQLRIVITANSIPIFSIRKVDIPMARKGFFMNGAIL